MKFKILPLAIFVMLFTAAKSEKVSVATAEKVALNFFKFNASPVSGRGEVTVELKYARRETSNTIAFYVFDIKPLGFVIVTADDNLEPVIAYSIESDFHTDEGRTGVTDWMDHAAAKITYALNNHAKANGRISYLWQSYLNGINPGYAKSSSVQPLLTTTWDQEPYYNQLCPFDSINKLRCVAGCVATTMAQIMKFWNFPPQGSGTFSYKDETPAFSNNYGALSADFGATTYNWTEMPSSISAPNTAIATLMYQCGISVAMNYGSDKQGGSSAYVLQNGSGGNPCAQTSYYSYFSYDSSSLQGVYANNYTSAAWLALLEGELNAGRPIQYEGEDPGVAGHTWVCDGYDASGMFHMNWGWGGYDDGYYSLDSLAVINVNLSTNEAAVIGIKPGTAKAQVTAGENIINPVSFKLYPNPAAQHLSVEYTGPNNGALFTSIYSAAGQKILSEESNLTDGLSIRQMDISQLANGVYILEIESNGDLSRQKFVVTK